MAKQCSTCINDYHNPPESCCLAAENDQFPAELTDEQITEIVESDDMDCPCFIDENEDHDDADWSGMGLW